MTKLLDHIADKGLCVIAALMISATVIVLLKLLAMADPYVLVFLAVIVFAIWAMNRVTSLGYYQRNGK